MHLSALRVRWQTAVPRCQRKRDTDMGRSSTPPPRLFDERSSGIPDRIDPAHARMHVHTVGPRDGTQIPGKMTWDTGANGPFPLRDRRPCHYAIRDKPSPGCSDDLEAIP